MQRFFKRLTIGQSCDPVIPLPGRGPKDSKSQGRDAHTFMCVLALFTTDEKWNRLDIPQLMNR